MSARPHPGRKPVVLVMTATISPPKDAPLLARADPAVRLQDYCEALEFYARVPSEIVDRIVFIENSNSDLSALRAIADASGRGKQIELIGFDGNDHDPRFGKGYGEFRMLDHGLARSSLISAGDVLWKVTGRLRVLNLAELVRTAPSEYGMYCDLRDVPLIGDRLGGNRWMDLRLFSCRPAAYDRLMRGQYPKLLPELCGSPENYFFDRLRRAGRSEGVVARFRIQPELAGFGGHLNVDYRSSSYRRKDVLRKVARTVAPWLWL